MQRTISIMTGKGSVNHNDRKFTAENVDKERTQNNITYCNENIRTVYHKLFDDAVKSYNERQTRSDRQITNYYKKISQESKQEKPFQEIIVQIGDKDNMGAMTENGQLAKKILDEYMKGFQDRNPNLYVFSAHLHMDETTPHLHIDFVPFTTGSKRGLDTRVSMKGALKQQGFIGTGRSDTERAQWAESEKEALSKIMLVHGIEWEQKGTHEKHKTVSEFKRDMLAKEVDELAEKKDDLLHTMSAYTKAEEYAHLTVQKIKNNDDFDMPEPPPLMSAKTYKTKFIEPFVKRIMKIIENLARRCYRAEKIAEQAEAKVKPLEKENKRLRDQLWHKNMALSKAEVKVRDFDRIKSYVGAEQINRWLKEIVHLGKNKSRSNNHIER